ncbi:DUF371 domain-containing protein, partial [Candidatus Woesearchaeota archaeon]|nr:DUF371 domain-containing protein [Candidatus Woesearchaeota archaeon]
MDYIFTCIGNPNILATNQRVIKFVTKDFVSLDETSILGLKATFEFEKLKEFLNYNLMNVILICDDVEDSFMCNINPYFISKDVLTFRKSYFESDNTFGTFSEKAASDINKKLILKIKN